MHMRRVSSQRSVIYIVLLLWTLFTFFIAGWAVNGSLLSIREMVVNPLSPAGAVDPVRALTKGVNQFEPQLGEQWRQRDGQYFALDRKIQRTDLALNNYRQALTKQNMGRYFVNSSVVAVISVLIVCAISTMAAYALSRWIFRLSSLILFLFIAGQSIPIQILLVPLKELLPRLGFRGSWLGEIAGMICVYVGTSIPFAVMVMSGYSRSLPSELEEAAALEGCGTFRTFRSVILPLSMPGIMTTAIILFLDVWNEYILALTLMVKEKTVSIGLFNLIPKLTPDWPAALSGIVVAMLPVVVVFILLQERIVKGITSGAVKA